MTSGNGHIELLTFSKAPERVVSLVPSMTGSLLDFGLAERLVGITEYCPEPQDASGPVVRVGGTKNTQVQAIINLDPDLVIANQEENSRDDIEKLDAAGLNVWITFPKSIDDTLTLLSALVNLFRIPEALPMIQMLEQSVSWTRRAHYLEGRPTFVPIWQGEHREYGRWWMTVHEDTYIHDVLRHCGAMNVFAERVRRYPLRADLGLGEPEPARDRDIRYPRVTTAEVLTAEPELILLPDEPFPFDERLRELVIDELSDTPAVKGGEVRLIDGSLITWPGTRLGAALAELPGIVAGQPI